MPPEWVWNAFVKCKVLIAMGPVDRPASGDWNFAEDGSNAAEPATKSTPYAACASGQKRRTTHFTYEQTSPASSDTN